MNACKTAIGITETEKRSVKTEVGGGLALKKRRTFLR